MSCISLIRCLMVIGCFFSLHAFSTEMKMTQLQNVDLLSKQSFLQGKNEFPQNFEKIEGWRKTLIPYHNVQFNGDQFWFVQSIYNDTDINQWVLYPYGSAVQHINFKIYSSDSIQTIKTGYNTEHQFPYHYGGSFKLEPNKHYYLVAHFSSDFFFAPIKLLIKPETDFTQQVILENAIILICFGIGIALGLYNLFIFIGSKEKVYLYYALFTFCWIWGWGHTLNIPEEWFGIRTPYFLMTGFLLLPLFNALFFINFLRVKRSYPLLVKSALGFGYLGLIGFPIAIFSPGWGLMFASVTTAGMLITGFVLGIKSLRSGFKPARYFLLAYFMLLAPNMIGNMMNMGFLPSINVNIYVLGLIGSMLDGLLLAFAMAEKVRIVNQENIDLNENLEEKIKFRTAELEATSQELMHANESKSRFLAQMSHEIRTPMNAVIGLSQLALKTPLNFEQKDYLQKISSSADVLLGIINDVLDYSKIEAGKLNVEKLYFSLDKVIDRALNVCSLRAHSKNIELILDIKPQVPKFIESDPLRLQQVLVNLISNAIKFTEYGHVSIRINSNELADGNSKLEFAVVDTGIGMDQNQLNRLFNSFSQADDSVTRKYGGTGLGLSISKELVELMGGEMWVNSKPNIGSAFHFSIVAQTNNTPVTQAKYTINGRNLKVLVVDDNEVAREVIGDIFIQNQADVTLVENGIQAINQVQQAVQNKHAFDLIIMDWRMPEMDGIQASRLIKKDLGIQNVPAILMVSAFDRDEAKQLSHSVGVDGFIEKPVNQSALLDAMSQCLPLDNIEINDLANKEIKGKLIDLSNIRLLLVEDNKLNRQVAIGFLKETGIQIDIAENGIQAIDKVIHQDFDIVLMDIQMPEMDGLTATQEIRNIEKCQNLPIIAMTAHAMVGDSQRSLAAGMNGHITKPVDPDELYRTIIKWIKKEQINSKNKSDATENRLFDLQSSPFLDVPSALKKMQGKESLYLELLETFVEENSELVERLILLNEQNDFDTLYLKVHSLRSNAAYIGAYQLASSSEYLELLIESKSNFESALKVVIDKLTNLLAEITPVVKRAKPALEQNVLKYDFKHDEVERLFNDLTYYLHESNAEVEDYIPKLKQLSFHLERSDLVEALIDLIDDVEYKEAIALIKNNRQHFQLAI